MSKANEVKQASAQVAFDFEGLEATLKQMGHAISKETDPSGYGRAFSATHNRAQELWQLVSRRLSAIGSEAEALMQGYLADVASKRMGMTEVVEPEKKSEKKTLTKTKK